MRKQILTACICFFFSLSYAQQPADSTADSLKIYRKIEDVAKKRKLTHYFYKAIFNLPDRTKKQEKKKKAVDYAKYNGRIIRKIFITTLDPFGYSVHDTSVSPRSFIQRGGNFLHQKSAQLTIKNQLLFRSGSVFDAFLVKESERILRSSQYVRDIVISAQAVRGSADSVDVYIREQDVWSKGVGVALNSSKTSLVLSDKNFLGTAHQVRNDLTYRKERRDLIAEGVYTIPYIRNTFITGVISYSSDPYDYTRGVQLSRPFYSPVTKWAGGINISEYKASAASENPETDTAFYSTRFADRDFWLQRSFRLSGDTSEETRSTRLVLSGRFLRRHFSSIPPEHIAPSQLFESSRLYLVGIGLSNRTYYQDYYIYRYGIKEDVPTGRLIHLLAGIEEKPSGIKTYGGLVLATGNHFDRFGYLTGRFSIGSYFRNMKAGQGVIDLSVGYFSDLVAVKRTNIRQFISLKMTAGLNRLPTEELNINEENGIKGFESAQVRGTRKAVLSFQTQAYLPFQVIGFRFAPFLFANYGLISDNEPVTRSKLYQAYGIGLLVKNELLVINTFQFSIGFYPVRPDDVGLLRINPVKSYDFSFTDFDIGKPGQIPYQ